MVTLIEMPIKVLLFGSYRLTEQLGFPGKYVASVFLTLLGNLSLSGKKKVPPVSLQSHSQRFPHH